MLFLLLACTGEEDTEPPRTNNVPTLLEVRLDPPEVRATDTVQAIPSASDLDGDDITFSFDWTLDGIPVTDVDGDTWPAGRAIRDQVLEVEVGVSDGFSFGEPYTAQVTLLNSPPTIDDLHIEPETPGIGDPLECYAVTADADGDGVSSTFSWTVDGVDQGPGDKHLERDFARNTQLTCTITSTDSIDTTGPLTSEVVTIGNSPPTVPVLELRPDPPTACAAGDVFMTSESVDPDGDPLTYEVEWRDGDGNVIWSEFEYPAETFETQTAYQVAVWSDDGFFQSEPATLDFTAISGGETVGNGVDDDCDGLVDEWIDAAWESQQLWWGQVEDGQAGYALGVGDLDADGLDDLVAGRVGESDLLIWYGRNIDPASPVLGDPDLEIEGAKSTASVSLADVDGDGRDDLLVGVPGDDTADLDAGAAYLVYAHDLVDGGELSDLATWSYLGDARQERLGSAVALGDLNGDGHADIALGEPTASAPGTDAGEVYVFLNLGSSPDVTLQGGGRSGEFGTSVSIIDDISGDGVAELAVGAPARDDTEPDGGLVAIWFGGSGLSDGLVEDADVRIGGSIRRSYLGAEPVGAADMDGDGIAELAIGTQETRDGVDLPGTIWLFDGSTLAADNDLTAAFASVEGTAHNGWLGLYGAGPLLGDTDGSGSADLVVGAGGEGVVYLWRGSQLIAGGTFTEADATIVVAQEDAGDSFGRWGLLADTDGDGVQDLISSAYRSDVYADRGGALYVMRPPFGVPAQNWEPECERVDGLTLCRRPKTWADARVHCQSLLLDLVQITDTADNAALGAIADTRYPAGRDRGQWWIGLSDATTEGTWVWLDETSETTVTAWASTPTASTSRNCAVLNEPGLAEWDDLGCDEERFFLCR